jgi:MoaA/NifB/PqqE/SkfB family radical SAM enzyme
MFMKEKKLKEKEEPVEEKEVSEKVETVIDRLVEYVQKKGKVDVKEAANAMALEKDQIEELAEVLKDSGLMDINYTLLGTFLIAKELPKEKAKVEEKKDRSQMTSMMVALDKDLRDSHKSFEFVEQNIRKRLDKDEVIMNELESKVHDVSIADMEYLLREARELRVVTKHFRKDIRSLREKVKRFHERVKKLEVETMKAEQERLGPRKPWHYPISMFFTRLKNTFKRG